MHRSNLVLVAVLALAVDLAAQSPPPTPARFEVASIKLNPNQSRGGPRRFNEFTMSVVRLLPGGRMESVGNSLQNMIAWAYQLNGAYQRVEGKQDILLMEFDIFAKAEMATVTVPEVRAMLRTLLEERFQLRWHWQPREIDSYLLVPARNDGRQGPRSRHSPKTVPPARVVRPCPSPVPTGCRRPDAAGPATTANNEGSVCRWRPSPSG
jgi:uncharacterized protein (TIGR03435 family)